MNSLLSSIMEEISDSLAKAIKSADYSADNVRATVSLSEQFGDISSTVALKIAKTRRANPRIICSDIIAKLSKPPYISMITIENNFINFHIDKILFCRMLIEHEAAYKTTFISPKSAGKKIAIIEYPAVNPNKPWHVGHLRNALIGDCIANIYNAMGYTVQRQDYIDDLGLQVAEVVWWYQNTKPQVPHGRKFDKWLGEEYVKLNNYIKDTDFKEQISKVLSLMEQDGTYEQKFSREISDECVRAQYQTAFSLNIYHDIMVWESDIVREGLLTNALSMLTSNGIANIETEGDYKGCLVIDLSKAKSLPEDLKGLKETKKVLLRSDGTPTYLAKDIAFHMWKFGVLGERFKYSLFMEKQPNGKPLYTTSKDGNSMKFANAYTAINVIGSAQSHPQSILRLAFASIGREDISSRIKHLSYGEVELESGSISGRKGTWMGYSADEIIEESISRAKMLISSKFEFGESEKEKIARSVAISAIKFEFLKFGTEKNIVFSWERAMNFDGNSGPYQQYMYARANRILEDSEGKRGNLEVTEITDNEFRLAKQISMAKDIIEKSYNEGRPNVITDYLNDLSSAFSKFYDTSPILKADINKREFRIRLTELFREVSSAMLGLLGIEPLGRM